LIKERWGLDSSNFDELKAKRKELISKTEEIFKEVIWKLLNISKNTLEAVRALRTTVNGY